MLLQTTPPFLGRAQSGGGVPSEPGDYSPLAWFDPSDSSTVWQDTSATTPAGDGDPVARIDDKSGNGRHATQSNSSYRPILRQSGSAWYLDFDGTNDHLQIGSGSQPFGATLGDATVAIAYHQEDASFNYMWALSNTTSPYDNIFSATGPTTGFGGSTFSVGRWGGSISQLSSGDVIDADTDVCTLYVNDATNTERRIRVNGSQVASDARGQSITTDGVAYIARRHEHLNHCCQMLMYGFIVFPSALNTAQAQAMEAWLEAKYP